MKYNFIFKKKKKKKKKIEKEKKLYLILQSFKDNFLSSENKIV